MRKALTITQVCLLLVIGTCMLTCDKASSPKVAGPTTRVFDLSGQNFTKLDWPVGVDPRWWALAQPGPVEILLPDGLKLSGTPVGIVFGRNATGGGGILYANAGERFSEAYQRAIDYCNYFGVPTKDLEFWKEHGGGTNLNPTEEAILLDGNVEIRVKVSYCLPPPRGFATAISYGWKKQTPTTEH
jgi:hypothetical protein